MKIDHTATRNFRHSILGTQNSELKNGLSAVFLTSSQVSYLFYCYYHVVT